MQMDLEYAEQCRKFCTYRYEFYKLSDAYVLVQHVIEVAFKKYGQQTSCIFNDDILKIAKQLSPEAVKAIELDLKYNSPWSGNGSKVLTYTKADGDRAVKTGSEISVFDIPYLMKKEINISVSMKEFLTLDSSIEAIKSRIRNQFLDDFPKEIGLPERMRNKKTRTLQRGKFLNFDRWERCLIFYDKATTKNMKPSEIAKEYKTKINDSGNEVYGKDRSTPHNRVTNDIKEARRLIEAAANGTFPHSNI